MQQSPVTPPQLGMPFGSMEAMPGYQLGAQLPELAERHAVLAPFGRYLQSMGSDDHGPAALIGALMGGAAGAGLGYLRGSNPLLWGLGGAAAGGLGSYLIGNAVSKHRRSLESKQAAWYAMDDEGGANGSEEMMDIQAKLFQDYSASSQVKAELIRLLQSLDPRQLERVHSLVRGAIGGGAAFLVAKYLLGLGLGTSTLMGLIGGGMGMMSGQRPMNAFGQRVDTQRNIFGQNRVIANNEF